MADFVIKPRHCPDILPVRKKKFCFLYPLLFLYKYDIFHVEYASHLLVLEVDIYTVWLCRLRIYLAQTYFTWCYNVLVYVRVGASLQAKQKGVDNFCIYDPIIQKLSTPFCFERRAQTNVRTLSALTSCRFSVFKWHNS